MTLPMDFAAQGVAHLTMMFNCAMKLRGLPAQIFDRVVIQNDYTSIQPEYSKTSSQIGTCTVILSKPMTGLSMGSDFISLPDKVSTEYTLLTLTSLLTDQQLLITYPDTKTLNLRITEADTDHEYSTIAFQYRAVVI